MVETEAGISRDTAERLLTRMAAMGLLRESPARDGFGCGQPRFDG